MLIPFLFSLACSKQENEDQNLCQDQYFGQFFLSDSSKSSLPYDQGQNLTFKDSANNELIFSTIDWNLEFLKSFGQDTSCPYDVNQQITYESNVEEIQTAFGSLDGSHKYELDMRLQVWPHYVHEGDSTMLRDLLYVLKLTKTENRDLSFIGILVDQRNTSDSTIEQLGQDYTNRIDSIILNDKIFHNVYVSDNNDLYYTHREGIIAFKDSLKKLWVIIH